MSFWTSSASLIPSTIFPFEVGVYCEKFNIALIYFRVMDKFTREQRSRVMQAIRSEGSQIESLLMKALWSRGYRYRKHDRNVFGKPDIVLRSHKIAIFCDSEFWHGKDWNTAKKKIKSNVAFWHKKIESNIRRDKEVNAKLVSEGWQVLRFWGKDIQKNIAHCLSFIEKAIIERAKDGRRTKRWLT